MVFSSLEFIVLFVKSRSGARAYHESVCRLLDAIGSTKRGCFDGEPSSSGFNVGDVEVDTFIIGVPEFTHLELHGAPIKTCLTPPDSVSLTSHVGHSPGVRRSLLVSEWYIRMLSIIYLHSSYLGLVIVSSLGSSIPLSNLHAFIQEVAGRVTVPDNSLDSDCSIAL